MLSNLSISRFKESCYNCVVKTKSTRTSPGTITLISYWPRRLSVTYPIVQTPRMAEYPRRMVKYLPGSSSSSSCLSAKVVMGKKCINIKTKDEKLKKRFHSGWHLHIGFPPAAWFLVCFLGSVRFSCWRCSFGCQLWYLKDTKYAQQFTFFKFIASRVPWSMCVCVFVFVGGSLG